jgi:polyhydroxybutyrate depolymerase
MTKRNSLLIGIVLSVVLLIAGSVTAQSFTITHGDLERTYDLFVPSTYDPERPLPLLIALHPSGGDAESMAQITGFNEIAEREGFIVLYPEGPYGYWDYGWNLREWSDVEDMLDDPGYVSAAIDEVMTSYSVDTEEVYAVGYSNGARMAFRLGCDLAGKITAIAAVSATISDDITGACPPENHVSVFYMHGTEDTVTPWDGKPLYLNGEVIANAFSAFETMSFWATQNECTAEPVLAQKQDPNPDDGKSIQVALFRQCADGTKVVFYALTGGGHEWPINDQINTGEMIWDFFENR